MVGDVAQPLIEHRPNRLTDVIELLADVFARGVAPGRDEQIGEGALEDRDATRLEEFGIPAHLCEQGLLRGQREDRCLGHAQRLRRLVDLALELAANLLGIAQVVPQDVDLVQHHQAVGGLVLAHQDVVAPNRHVRLRDTGVRSEDEHRHLGAREQAEGQLRLGAERVQPRRVDHHQALL